MQKESSEVTAARLCEEIIERFEGEGQPATLPAPEREAAAKAVDRVAESPLARWSAAEDLGSHAIVGSSPAFRGALRYLSAIVESPAPVLLLGESGTGKELLARKIHDLGPRRSGPFVALNCAAIPADLFESELFGHATGAFSGATSAKPGLFEIAHRGTLLLDEIGELPPLLRPKLLRVLEDKEVRRLGETRARTIDFRLISATSEDLVRAGADGRFRKDLLYRINVFTLKLPPLRERASDIPELARHLLARAAQGAGRARPVISPAAMEILMGYAWPGNVRELANVLERASALAIEGVIEPCHLGIEIEPGPRRRGTLRETVAQVERDLVTETLAAQGGNVSAAARDLGIARQQLQRLVRRYGLRP